MEKRELEAYFEAKKPRACLGIDPGYSGGIVLLSQKRKVVFISALEEFILGKGRDKTLDCQRLASILKSKGYQIIAVLEKAQAMPRQGVVSMFKYGVLYGQLKAVLSLTYVPFIEVPPGTWMKKMFEGYNWKGRSKELSPVICSNLFPEVDLRRNTRSRVPHSGICDALLLAEYGLRKYIDKL